MASGLNFTVDSKMGSEVDVGGMRFCSRFKVNSVVDSGVDSKVDSEVDSGLDSGGFKGVS